MKYNVLIVNKYFNNPVNKKQAIYMLNHYGKNNLILDLTDIVIIGRKFIEYTFIEYPASKNLKIRYINASKHIKQRIIDILREAKNEQGQNTK